MIYTICATHQLKEESKKQKKLAFIKSSNPANGKEKKFQATNEATFCLPQKHNLKNWKYRLDRLKIKADTTP